MYNNMTQVANFGNLVPDTKQTVLHALVSFCFFLFLFLTFLILHIFFTSPHIREQARYILFAHMLINDTLFLVDGLFLLYTGVNLIYVPVPICYVMVSLATVLFKITPFNLVAMALERYAAVCFPLRHGILCTPQKSYYTIALIWFFGFTPCIIDFIALWALVDKKFFLLSILCRRENITVSLVQGLLKNIFTILTLVFSGLIIAFTYIRVISIAKNMSSRHDSALKTGKTVLLHGVQFFLCLFSLTSGIFEAQYKHNTFYLPIINFLVFMCLPRILSPIIYGLRDQFLRKCIRNLQFVKH